MNIQKYFTGENMNSEVTYLKLRTQQRYTKESLSQMGIKDFDSSSLSMRGYAIIEDKKPIIDQSYYKLVPKEKLTKVDDFNYIQDYDIVKLPLDVIKNNYNLS